MKTFQEWNGYVLFMNLSNFCVVISKRKTLQLVTVIINLLFH